MIIDERCVMYENGAGKMWHIYWWHVRNLRGDGE